MEGAKLKREIWRGSGGEEGRRTLQDACAPPREGVSELISGSACGVYICMCRVCPESGKGRPEWLLRLREVAMRFGWRSSGSPNIKKNYLHADPEKRGQQIKALEDSKFLTRNSIIGGDFNCVENTKIDVQYPPGVNSTYSNAHAAPLRNLLASINQTDLSTASPTGTNPG
eukprot:scaffold3013_cov113-Isochrysis_galbana.AAC.13